jgi:hypothetical protein
MAEGSRSSGSGQRRVYRNGSSSPSRRPKRAAEPSGGGKSKSGRRSRPRVRAARPLWQRILRALLVVLAVAAVSFLIGYLIGLKLAIVAFAAL